jgi:hypothetical protein
MICQKTAINNVNIGRPGNMIYLEIMCGVMFQYTCWVDGSYPGVSRPGYVSSTHIKLVGVLDTLSLLLAGFVIIDAFVLYPA